MKLYKYYSIEAGLEALAENKIYLTPPKYFNDPFEFSPIYSRDFTEKEVSAYISTRRHQKNLRHAMKRNKKFNGSKADFKKWIKHNRESILPELKADFQNASETVRKDFVEIVSESTGVCSLSKNHNNILMWSHYADSHKGIVVGYDLYENKKDGISIRNVKYSDERVKINPNFIFRMSEYTKDAYKVIFSKSSQWEYENEYRIVGDLSKCREQDKGDGNTYYYIPLKPKNTIELYLGLRIAEESKKKILDILKRISAIKVYCAHLGSTAYNLEFEELS